MFTIGTSKSGRWSQKKHRLLQEPCSPTSVPEEPCPPRVEDDFSASIDDAIPDDGQQHRGMYEMKSMGKGSIHVKLLKWLPLRQIYLDEIIRRDGRARSTSSAACTECAAEEGEYRCRDCYIHRLFCGTCMKDMHITSPLHRIEWWTGTFFKRASLHLLNLRIQLGHDGGECPQPARAQNRFAVMDANGFHLVNADYCGCSQQTDRYVQLLWAGLFPASTDRPQTAFTFDVLEMFHELTLQGKMTAFDFYRTILRRTDGGKIISTNQYKGFSFAVRLWRNLVMLKRAGRGHDPQGAEATAEGELALQCPACPQPEKNLPRGWEQAPNEMRDEFPLLLSDQFLTYSTRWLYTQFVAVDANFRLKLKERGFRDIELAPGWAYLVEEHAYLKTISKFTEDSETNTCRSQHNAVLTANLHNTQNYRASGTGAVVCGRHSLVIPTGVGDLQKGERYSNMDYIVLSALCDSRVRDVLISYDIACQWSKNLETRIPCYPPSLRLDLNEISVRTAVPKFHLPAHGPSCQTCFSLNFMQHVGRTYGEGVESEWAHINGTAVSTREMAPAVRHETLNDHWSGWNWQKIIGFGTYFLRKLAEAHKWSRISRHTFLSLSETVPEATIKEWNEMVDRWNNDEDAPDPYAEPEIELTINDIRLQFAKEDAEDAARGIVSAHEISEQSFVVLGLELEERQRLMATKSNSNTRHSTAGAQACTQQSRNALFRQITQWRHIQDVYMPGAAVKRRQVILPREETVDGLPDESPLAELTEDGRPVDAENLLLLLPSDIPFHATPALIVIEAKLRYAQANDALANIRHLHRAVTGIRVFKRKNTNGLGNRPNTRMHSLLQRFHLKIKHSATRYRVARHALLLLSEHPLARDKIERLHGEGDWRERFKVLRDDDIRGPDRDEELEESEGRRIPSWIWLVSNANTSADGSLIEFGDSIRAEWAGARARMERWQEEITLLGEEMRRVLEYLKWLSRTWLSRSHLHVGVSDCLQDGLAAYAAKQSALLEGLADSFARKWVPYLHRSDKTPAWALDFVLTSPDIRVESVVDHLGRKETMRNVRAADYTSADETSSETGDLMAHDESPDGDVNMTMNAGLDGVHGEIDDSISSTWSSDKDDDGASYIGSYGSGPSKEALSDWELSDIGEDNGDNNFGAEAHREAYATGIGFQSDFDIPSSDFDYSELL